MNDSSLSGNTLQVRAEPSANIGGSVTQIDTNLAQPSSRPVRYQVVSRDGGITVLQFNSAREAADWASRTWPDQSQDPDRTGAGWDIEVVR